MIFPDYKYDRLGVGESLDFGIKLAVLKQVNCKIRRRNVSPCRLFQECLVDPPCINFIPIIFAV